MPPTNTSDTTGREQMSYLKAISEALESQRYRYLPGGDKGIARAILRRADDPDIDAWEWLGKIVVNALQKEQEVHMEGVEKDLGDVRWADELSKTKTEKELRERLAYLNSLHVGPEISDSAHRSTSKAVSNEAARDAFGEKRVIKMALEFLGVPDDD